MPYTAPTKATFVAVFPAFAAVTDDQYTFWSAQAVLITEPIQGCLDAQMDLATMLVTAHNLALQGIGTGAESQLAAQGMAGFKRIKSGSVDLERADKAGDASAGVYGSTSYGLRAWPMLKACLAGPRVTGTGTIPVVPHGYPTWGS